MNIHRCRFVDYTPHSITSLKFSSPSTTEIAPRDLRLAVGRSNGDIEIWNPRWSWIHEMTLKGGRGRSIEGLAWSTSEDGVLRLFSIGGSTSITEWDLQSGLPLANHDCNSGVIWSLSASDDGTKLAVGCDNGSVVIVDVSGGPGVMEHLKILQPNNARVMCVTWKGKDQVVGGCSDARIRVWSTKNENNGRIVHTMKVDKAQKEDTLVWSVQVLKKSKQIISGDSTGSVKFWDGNNFSLLQSFKVHEADVLCLASDMRGETIFSAGVDRKVVCYKMIDSKLKRWANVSNRLLHAQDIRAMASFEAKGASFLVSGGVERTLVINSVREFNEGMFRKIPITRHRPCVSVAAEPRLVMMWSDQAVKIWQIDQYAEPDEENEESKGKRLVAKITLANEENITHATLSKSGSLLAVATLAETKIFQLTANKSGSLDVDKSEDDCMVLANEGAVLTRFGPDEKSLVMINPGSEAIVYNLETRELDELELPDPDSIKIKSKLGFAKNVVQMAVSDDGAHVATARLCGSVDIFDFKKFKHLGTITRVNSPPTALKFTSDNTLILVTAEIKVLEFNLDKMGLTDWSKRNSDLLPQELISLVDKCCGIFYDPSSSKRIWLWGANWLCFVDLSVNIATERVPKRKLDKLGVPVESEQMPDRQNLKRQLDVTRSQANGSTSNSSTKPFWITHKYRPMLIADSLGDGELVVVERPPFNIPLPPAFWSNHKIRM